MSEEPIREKTIDEELWEKMMEAKESIYIDGKEIPNPKPMFVPVPAPGLTLQQQVSRMLDLELSRRAEQLGVETLEDALDFEVDEEFAEFPKSPYEDFVEEMPLKEEDDVKDDADSDASEPGVEGAAEASSGEGDSGS